MTDRIRPPPGIRLSEAVKVWARIGLLSFGGPAGQIAMMHRELVDERGWLDEKTYLQALNFCMLLPGPEAMQLATYAGWRLHGWKGGLAAGTLFVLPGALAVLVLSMIYAAFGQVPLVAALLFGVKAAVLAIVVEALLRVARRALKHAADWLTAGLAFLALFVFAVPFPAVIAAAALFGYFRVTAPADGRIFSTASASGMTATALLWLALWLVPVAAIVTGFGFDHVFSQIALFFSKLAIVTFGGAYAVLAYMAQQAVDNHRWLTAPEMVDALGLAETTPGPLILVTQFVGYLAGHRLAGGVAGGIAGAAITLWVTFVPCFLWILTGAPLVERLQNMPRLSGALAAITAAVVGVILNLTIWFALHVLFARVERLDADYFRPWLPDVTTVDWPAAALSLVAAFLLLRFHQGIPRTLAICAVLGMTIQKFLDLGI